MAKANFQLTLASPLANIRITPNEKSKCHHIINFYLHEFAFPGNSR